MHTLETNPSSRTSPATAHADQAQPVTRARIAERITTTALAAVMILSGTAFVVGPSSVVEGIHRLRYPAYFTPLLGTAKLLGVAALLTSRSRVLREWAYAGFTFVLVGAILSHLLSGDAVVHALPAALVLSLLAGSHILRRHLDAGGTGVRPVGKAETSGFWRFAPWLTRLTLLPPVVIFVAVAARNLSDPVGVSSALGISLATPQAITTIRIGFGAFPLAFALFLAACLLYQRRLLVGLVLALAVAAVVTVVRAVGIAVDGAAAESVHLLHAELGLVAVLVLGLVIEWRRRSGAGGVQQAG